MEKVLGCVVWFVVYAALSLLLAWGFQGLWNWLMPLIFHLPTLTYWQAFGLMTLLSFVGGCFRSSTSSKKDA